MTTGRWWVLLKSLDEDSDRIPATHCVLHNICVLRGDEIDIDNSDGEDDDGFFFLQTTLFFPVTVFTTSAVSVTLSYYLSYRNYANIKNETLKIFTILKSYSKLI